MKLLTDPQIREKAFDDELLTVAEVAALLRVTHGWIAQRIHSKTLPFVHIKVGMYPRFPASGVRRFIEEQIAERSVAVK
jgi:excisionase family DNA binding protein